MASTVLPTVPYVVFMILEPITLFGGWVTALFDTPTFIADQYPTSTPSSLLHQAPNARILAMQLGNLYGLLLLLCVFFVRKTSDPVAIRNYLLCLAIADIGHVAPSLWMLGRERALDIGSWNTMAWGNIGGTAFLFVTRVAYLAGLFGARKAVKGKKEV